MERMIEARLREVELRHVGPKHIEKANMWNRISVSDTHTHKKRPLSEYQRHCFHLCWQQKIVKNWGFSSTPYFPPFFIICHLATYYLPLSESRHVLAADLSGGQKRRLCLAIAFLSGDKVVYCDEVTSGASQTLFGRQLFQIMITFFTAHHRPIFSQSECRAMNVASWFARTSHEECHLNNFHVLRV